MTAEELLEQYDELLDEPGPVKIGELEFERSRIVRELDPLAYQLGLSEYVDSMADDTDADRDELERLLLDAYEILERGF